MTMSTGWMTDVAIIPAAPPLMKGSAAMTAGFLSTPEPDRPAERVGAADIAGDGWVERRGGRGR